MVSPAPYISRAQTEDFLNAVKTALEQPDSHPVVFHVWGIGGVGKSTLLNRLREKYEEIGNKDSANITHSSGLSSSSKGNLLSWLYQPLGKSTSNSSGNTQEERSSNLLLPGFSTVFFSVADEIDSIRLMEKLHSSLQEQFKDVPPVFDSFAKSYKDYSEALYQLETKSLDGKGSASEEQIKLVKQFVRGVAAMGQLVIPAAGVAGQGAEVAVDAGKAIWDLFQQHKATQRDKELQKLMRDPVRRLTEKFTETLIQWSNRRSILLLLDTYEEASTEVDTWLGQILLSRTNLRSHRIRLVVAGRESLVRGRNWERFQGELDLTKLVYEQELKPFDKDQTKLYLRQINITAQEQIEKIYQNTKGLPYRLNWLRQGQQTGQASSFLESLNVIDLRLRDLSVKQELSKEQKQQVKRVIQVASCCLSFNFSLIKYLLEHQQVDFYSPLDNQLNWFEWLRQQPLVKSIDGRYQLDEMTRDEFRQSLWREDEGEQFSCIHALLADYFKAKSDWEVSPDSSLSVSVRYNNSEWQMNQERYIYHLLYSRRPDCQQKVISYLLEESRFVQNLGLKTILEIVMAESKRVSDPLLPYISRKFLNQIKPVVTYGVDLLWQEVIDYKKIQQNSNFSRREIDTAIQTFLYQLDQLEGLAKLTALLCKSFRYPKQQRLAWLQKAQEQAEKILTIDEPEFNSSLFGSIGWWLFNSEYKEEAIVCFGKSIEISPDYNLAWYSRGLALKDLERYKEALENFDKFLEYKPESYETWNWRGVMLDNLGQSKEALSSYDKALEYKPDYYYSLNNRATTLFDLRYHEKALVSIEEALSIKPDFTDALSNKAGILFKLGRFEEALASIDKAIELEPNDNGFWSLRGGALYGAERFEEAISSYEKAIQLNSNSELVWVTRGSALAKLEHYEEAINSYDKAIELDSKDSSAWGARGDALYSLKRREEALESYSKATEIEPSNYTVWISRGEVLYDLERYEEALASFAKALKLEPNDYYAWSRQGFILIALERYEEAIFSYKKALEIKCDKPFFWYGQAEALYRLKRHEEAIESLTRAIELPNAEPSMVADMYYDKARSYALLENVDSAVEALKQAIETDEYFREKAKDDLDFNLIQEDKQFQVLLADNDARQSNVIESSPEK